MLLLNRNIAKGGVSILALATLIGVGLFMKGACMPACAALGQPVASVKSDQVRMKGEVRRSAEAGYSVQRITTPADTVVKEYVSPAGTVFAVSWSGPAVPELQQLLGAYFAQLRAAAQA